MKPQLEIKPLLLMILLTGILGCTNEARYDILQSNQKFDCKNLPPAQYEDCINAPTKTFDEYESERKEVLTP